MSKARIRIISFLVLALFLIATYFGLIRYHLKPQLIENQLIPQLEEITSGHIEYDKFSISYFPKPQVLFRNLSYVSTESTGLVLKARRANLNLNIFAALLKKAAASKLEVRRGEISFRVPTPVGLRYIKIDNLDLQMSPIRPKVPMQIELSGDFEEISDSLHYSGTFQMNDFEQVKWEQIAMEGELEFLGITADVLQQFVVSSDALVFDKGVFSGKVNVHKLIADEWLKINGDLNLQGFIYQLIQKDNVFSSSPIDSSGTFEVEWNPTSEEVRLNKSLLDSPIGQLDMAGSILLGTGEVQNMRVSLYDIVMESVVQYLPSLKEIIPFNLGFSGESDLEMSVEGTLDHLSIHANWDLTESLFVYAKYFNKPKDLPVIIIFDYLLKDLEHLSGDFSLRLKSASIKGTLTELQTKSGDGQLNIITNKFDLADWRGLILPLEDYYTEGQIKILLNLKGNLGRLHEAERLMNLTLSNGAIRKKSITGGGFDHIDISLDYSPLALDLKKVNFIVAGDPVEAKLKIYNLEKAPIWQAEISSEEFNLAAFFKETRLLADDWISDERKKALAVTEKHLAGLFPMGYGLKDFRALIKSQGKEWDLSGISFSAYDGDISAQATLNYDSHFPTYWANLSVDQLSLAKFTGRLGSGQNLMGGKMFFQGQFVGVGFEAEDWQKRVQGEGDFMVTNGEFQTFDVLGAVADIKEFSDLNLLISETTRFDDLHGKYSLKNERVSMDFVEMLSKDLRVEAEGSAEFDGVLNYRLNVYLSPQLTNEILSPLMSVPDVYGDQYFGPIPLLLSGDIFEPELKPDSLMLADLLDLVSQRRTHKVLRNFLPERSLLDRREREDVDLSRIL